jgi:hypothetical protein
MHINELEVWLFGKGNGKIYKVWSRKNVKFVDNDLNDAIGVGGSGKLVPTINMGSELQGRMRVFRARVSPRAGLARIATSPSRVQYPISKSRPSDRARHTSSMSRGEMNVQRMERA